MGAAVSRRSRPRRGCTNAVGRASRFRIDRPERKETNRSSHALTRSWSHCRLRAGIGRQFHEDRAAHLQGREVSPEAAPPSGYSGTPLAQKLGLKDGQRVLFIALPTDLKDLRKARDFVE